jgi:hypothetical protein
MQVKIGIDQCLAQVKRVPIKNYDGPILVALLIGKKYAKTRKLASGSFKV